MICQRCGTINDGGDQFCGSCGAVLASSGPSANNAPAVPTSSYESAMNAPTVAQPLAPASPHSGLPPTQYVPQEYSPGAGWAASQNGASPPPQPTWADLPAAQPALPGPPPARVAPRRRRRRWPWYLLLFLVILGLVGAAGWVLVLRPALHQTVDAQIRQGLQQSVDEISPLPAEVPSDIPFPVTEDQINDYLARHVGQLAPITDMRASLQPGVMIVTFQTYGFGSTVRLGLGLERGTLVAQHVSVSGLLSWVESADDLTARFNEALRQVPGKLGRSLASVSIDDGAIRLSFA